VLRVGPKGSAALIVVAQMLCAAAAPAQGPYLARASTAGTVAPLWRPSPPVAFTGEQTVDHAVFLQPTTIENSRPANGSTLQCGANDDCFGAPACGSECPPQGACDLPAVCDECPHHGLLGFVSYDSFRGIADDSWQNNGIVVGFNYGTRLGVVSDWTGIGFQIGASVGVFDWSGTDYRPVSNAAETQGFLTYGFFRRANETSNWTAALVQDTMYNNNFGVFGQNPTMSQMRGWLGYCTSAWNEFGIWGTWRGWGQTIVVPSVGPTTWQPVQQLNVFWHHKWQAFGPDTWFWVGRPEQSRLTRDGSLGDYLAGAAATAPLSERVSIFALATYMHPSAGAGVDGSHDESWNFTIGLAFYPRPNARASTVAGRCWMPFLPVANNGYFLVDTNR